MKVVVEELLTAAELKVKVNICTIVDAPSEKKEYVGQMMLIYPDGRVSGTLGNEDLTQLIMAKVNQSLWEHPVILEFEHNGRYRIFWDCVSHSPKAIVFGAGHISQPLVEILSIMDFSVTVVDDRPDFANVVRFPRAAVVICDRFEKALQTVKPDDSTAVIIVTRGHRYDIECLRSMVTRECGYIGMIGSRRRVSSIRKLMAEEGVSEERLARLHSPIGLGIGAQTPAEIAVSIAAEVIAAFRLGSASQSINSCQEVSDHG